MKFKEGKVDIRYFVFGICFLFLLGIVSADIVSINSGGDNQLVINPESTIEGFFFNFNLRPLMSNVILNSTFGTNLTTENLTVYYVSSDPDDDSITNISDWRVGGNSIAVLNMPFDSYKVQGDVRDYSSYENNGTLGGSPSWDSNCQVGGCYEFDGVDDYVSLNSFDGFSSPVGSISYWMKLNANNINQGIYRFNENGNSEYIRTYIASTNRMDLVIEEANVVMLNVYYDLDGLGSYVGDWVYVTWTQDGTGVKLYIDGIERTLSGTNNGNWWTDHLAFADGTIGVSWAYFNGSIDEFKVYDRALSIEQVKLNYQVGLAGKSTDDLASQETEKGETWQVAMTSNDGFYDSLTVLSNELTIVNDAPLDPEPILVSVDGTNESDADLNCSSFIYDGDSETLNVTVRWYKDDVLNMTTNYYDDYSNGTLFYSILDSSSLTLGDVWMCEMRVYDESDNSNWVESNNLTIIDITDPIVYIISPESTNYSTLNVSFNVSIIENENMSMCFYDLDSEGNVSMNELNDSYFWSEPSLGPGDHEVWFYCNDTSGNWGMNYTNFTIDNEAAIAILLSDELQQQVRWNVLNLPIDDLDAIGNNLNNSTDYYVNISATNTLVDLYVKADGDLFTAGLDIIGLGNETFAFSDNNSYVNDTNKVVMNTSYILIGSNLPDNSTIYMKFYLDAPSSQAAGQYLNQLDFKAVREGEAP